MSALTDLFTSMANKIRSKTGGSDTYTPTEMVSAVDDVYDAGYADATTPITPSNSSPASMTANTGYRPTTNGYAIASQPTSITPSDSSPTALTTGEICNVQSSGYAIEHSPVPLDSWVNPEGSSVSLGDIVRFTRDAYVIPGEYPVYPSDSNPPKLEYVAKGGFGYHYAIDDVGGGYAIASLPVSKTPSDVSPARVSSGSIVRPSASGYLYATNTNFKYGTVADKSTANEEFSIDTGLQGVRKFIMWGRNRNDDRTPVIIFDGDIFANGKFSTAGIQTGAAAQRPTATIGDNSTAYNGSIKSINNGIVTIRQSSSLDNIFATGIQWVAIP